MLDLKQCPHCREQTDLENDVCPYCGYRFNEPASPAARSPSPAKPQSRCPNCGAWGLSDRPVCPVCRTPLVRTGSLAGRVMVVIGFIAVVLVLAMFILNLPQLPTGIIQPVGVQNATPAPTLPQCNIAISGQRVSAAPYISLLWLSPAHREISGNCG